MHFNPRSREGSDSCAPSHATAETISIHAPVKGATILRHFLADEPVISIHAPVKGATHAEPLAEMGLVFQSTLP